MAMTINVTHMALLILCRRVRYIENTRYGGESRLPSLVGGGNGRLFALGQYAPRLELFCGLSRSCLDLQEESQP